jgi:peptidoglycan/LPS O-acetylase OafA/YrhL
LYIVHFPALLVVRRLLEALGYKAWSSAAQTLAFAASAAGAIALAAVLFYLVERPARQHLRNRMGVLAAA